MSTVTDFQTDILDLLWLHHASGCLDPRDRLFALSLLLKKQTRFVEILEESDSEEEDSEKEDVKEGTSDEWGQMFSYDQEWSELHHDFA